MEHLGQCCKRVKVCGLGRVQRQGPNGLRFMAGSIRVLCTEGTIVRGKLTIGKKKKTRTAPIFIIFDF